MRRTERAFSYKYRLLFSIFIAVRSSENVFLYSDLKNRCKVERLTETCAAASDSFISKKSSPEIIRSIRSRSVSPDDEPLSTSKMRESAAVRKIRFREVFEQQFQIACRIVCDDGYAFIFQKDGFVGCFEIGALKINQSVPRFRIRLPGKAMFRNIRVD